VGQQQKAFCIGRRAPPCCQNRKVLTDGDETRFPRGLDSNLRRQKIEELIVELKTAVYDCNRHNTICRPSGGGVPLIETAFFFWAGASLIEVNDNRKGFFYESRKKKLTEELYYPAVFG